MLAPRFRRTMPAASNVAALRRFLKDPTNFPAPGAYDDGLLSIFDEARGEELMRPWNWLVGRDAVAIVGTGFGDLYYWDGTNVCQLETQRGEVEPIDPEIEWFLSDFLIHPAIVSDVLREPYFQEVAALHGPLSYDNVFILKPWLLLGGVDRPEHYDAGDRLVYGSLVSQTLER